MDTNRDKQPDRAYITTGVKTAAFVVILGVMAAMADHAFYGGHERAHASEAPPAAVATAPAQPDGFALPAELRANAAEVPAPPPTF